MVLFYKYSRRTLAFLAVVLVVEYAIVHRISLDALHRSETGLSQWRQLVSACNCTDCEVRHLTLIHDGLYQRAYSVHLMHRVLAISSEDGDPYEAFAETGDGSAEGEGFEDRPSESEDDDLEADLDLTDSASDDVSVTYAYAPGDMLSIPAVPAPAAFQASAGRQPSEPIAGAPAGGQATVPALPQSVVAATPREKAVVSQQQGQGQHQARAAAAAAAPAAAASDSPRLLQAIVWQPGKVLSLFPWQLRSHFFLSLASTRMYLLMGLWPRTAPVVAAAPRRLRQQHSHHGPHYHSHAPGMGPAAAPGSSSGGGGGGMDGSTIGSPPYNGGVAGAGPGPGYYPSSPVGQHPHAQAQAAAAAHAYAHYAHGHDGHGGLYGLSRSSQDESQSLAAALSALGRGVPVFLPPEMLVKHGVQEDLMASCAFKPAVKHAPADTAPVGSGEGGSAVGEGDPPLLPRWRALPSLLGRWVAQLAGRIAERGGLIAASSHSSPAQTAVGDAWSAAVVAGGGSGEGAHVGAPVAVSAVEPVAAAGVHVVAAATASDGSKASVVTASPGQARLPGPTAGAGGGGSGGSNHGGSGTGGGALVPRPPVPASDTPAGPGTGSQGPAQAEPHQAQQPQHAYVECRLYRTDRIRNVSYTCPAVLTVLPSPPRSSAFGLSRLLQRLKPRAKQQQQPAPQSPPPHFHAAHAATGGGPSGRPHPRPRSRLLRRLWHDLRYMSYGVIMPYKWAPILAGMLSPHMFLLACLPAVQSLGLMGPFTVRLCAYHAVCLLMTAADHLLLLRLAAELWLRLRRARGPGGRTWRRWLVWGRWLLVDGFLASNWMFRVVVMGLLTSKQVELWKHLYGPYFRPHPLLSCCLVFPASWVIACAACSAAWRLLGSGGHQPTSAPLLLFQEGFLSGLSSPFYSLAYISFAVLGLGGGGVGGGAGGVLGVAAAGSLLPLWLLDTVAVSPLLAVVALDVLWNMDTAARATPLMLVVVNALRVHHPPAAVGAGGPAGRRAGGARGRGLLLGGGGDAAAAGGANGGVVAHTSLWMLVENARWWARQVRDAAEEQRRQLEAQQQQPQGGGGGQGPADGGQAAEAEAGAGWVGADGGPGAGGQPRGPREMAVGAVARVVRAARHAGMAALPRRAIAAMLAALLLPLPEARWPPRQQEHHARALDLLLEAAAAAGPPGAGAGAARRGGRRRGRAAAGAGQAGAADDFADEPDFEEDEEEEGGWQEVDGVDELLGDAGPDGAAGGGGGAEDGAGGEGDRMVRTASGGLRPLSALEAELRAGQAQVAALRSQLAAAGRGVSDLLLLGRWPPPLELPPESHSWHDAVPHGFLCPITHALMTQPALLVSPDLSEASPTYELAAIRQWLRSNRTDPTTGRFLRSYHFIHNDNLRKAIEDWVQDRLTRERQAQIHQHRPYTPRRQGLRSPGRGRQLPHTPATAGPPTAIPPLPRDPAVAASAGPSPGGWSRVGSGGHGGTRQDLGSGDGGFGYGVGGTAGGRYQPVPGPGPGQRSVCVGTASELLRITSPERRRRGVGVGVAAGAGRPREGGFVSPQRSKSRGRSLSRGRGLQPADAAEGGAGGSAAVVVARQVVLRATSRQRGLQRSPGPQ